MKYMESFKDFKLNNQVGEIISEDDIVKCIENNGKIYTNIVNGYYKNNPQEPIVPVDIEEGVITVIIDGSEYTTNLKDVIKITQS